MTSLKKFSIYFVLMLLITSMIPVAIADGGEELEIIKGTDGKINVLYIGYDTFFNLPITEEMASDMYYGDDFSIHVFGLTRFSTGVDNTAEFEKYDLNTFDIIIIDMVIGELSDFEDALKAAQENGALLVAFNNGRWDGTGTDTPEFFDFRDAAEFTISDRQSEETIRDFFALHADAGNYRPNEILHQAYAENILMYLARVKSEDDASIRQITDNWERIKIAYVGFSNNFVWGLLNQYSSFMEVTNLLWWGHEEALAEFGQTGGFADQDIIILDMMTLTAVNNVDNAISNENYRLETLAGKEGTPHIVSVRSGMLDFARDIQHPEDPLAVDVVMTEQLLVLLGRELGGKEFAKNWELAAGFLSYGIYHPDLDRKYFETLDEYLAAYETPCESNPERYVYDDRNLTVGIWFHRDYFAGGNNARVNVINELIWDLESKGANVIAGFDVFRVTHDEEGNPINPMLKYYALNGDPNRILIDVAISIKDFGLNVDDYERGVEWLTELDVYVLKAIISSADGEIDQIPRDMLVYSTISPARDGMNEFILLGNNGNVFEEQADWLANRAIAWGYLRRTENQNKNVIIMYYNYPPGKAHIGANYLNVLRSLAGPDLDLYPNAGTNQDGVLRDLRRAGYTVEFDSLPINIEDLNETSLMELLFQQGINVGEYAPGVLHGMVTQHEMGTRRNASGAHDDDWWGATLVPVEKYKEWFDETFVNETLRNQVIDLWGTPWDYSISMAELAANDQNTMIWENEFGQRFFVLPAIRFGNVWLMPQPARASQTDAAFSYHGGDIPPTHQYIAFYLWMNNHHKPDALISFGTHGTHEWLPGTPYGLAAKDDFGPLLLQDIPNIYPYIVANVGEGLTAKYRGNALIISHMTPPMIRSNLDSNDNLRELELEIQAFFIGRAGWGTDTMVERQERIVDVMFDANIHNIIDMRRHQRAVNPTNPNAVTDAQLKAHLKTLSHDRFAMFLKDELYDYVSSIMENNLPFGMHVFGQSPTEVQISAMLRAMWGLQFDDVLFETYYEEEGFIGVPYESAGKILDLVADLSTVTTADEMMSILRAAYPGYSDDKHEAVVQFIIGPIMHFEGAADSNAVINDWKRTGAWEDLIDEIIFSYYFYMQNPPARSVISGQIEEVIEYCVSSGKPIDAALLNEALSHVFRTPSVMNTGVIAYLTGYGRLDYAQNLRDCGEEEIAALLNALNGGFVRPNAGNDPIQNPNAIPTGTNFYGIDPTKFPTKHAWEVGKSLAHQLMIDYYLKYGEFPNTVAFSRFGTEFIRDEGALEAMALYLLGVEPRWDDRGNVDHRSVTVIPLSELTITFVDDNGITHTIDRPRIDIVYMTAGMRDSFGDKLRLLNVAVRTVSNLDEPANRNYVRTNTNALKAAGLGDMAYIRSFAAAPGQYDVGTGNFVSASGSWDDPAAIVEMYLSKMSYAYGDDNNWGVNARTLLEALLKNVDASVHSKSSNLYDSLDNDDFFQYFGALNLAVQHLRPDGKMPEMYVADTRNVGQGSRNTGNLVGMREYINKDLESRYLNEEWIRGMMESGFSGSTMFAEFVDNMFGWAVTTGLISFDNWERVFEIYVNDSLNLGMNQYFERYPYTLQSITGRMLEAIRKDYLRVMADPSLSPEEHQRQVEKFDGMLQALVEQHMQSVVDHGASCCHHTCGNLRFTEFMSGDLAVLGVDPDLVQRFLDIINGVREDPNMPPSESAPTGGSGFGMATTDAGTPAEAQQTPDAGAGYGTETGQAGTPADTVRGYEMRIVDTISNTVRDFINNPTFSSSSFIAIAIVVLLVGAVFFGYRRKGI
ncbi:MAG: cobaltochelatase subunit CobN [Methanosarcinales archaeon]|jgi:cobalamin biosynthesis Mg chelatase CobN|nr:cobaltochelatase subunit CobN [Methanosarcinales archaeon]